MIKIASSAANDGKTKENLKTVLVPSKGQQWAKNNFNPLWRALFSTNKIGTSLFVVYGRGCPSYLRSLATWRFITLTFCFFFCFLLLTFCLMPIICEVSVALTSDHTLGCAIPRNVATIISVFTFSYTIIDWLWRAAAQVCCKSC